MPWQSMDHELDAGDHDPGFRHDDGGLVVFGQALILVEPGQCAFDHPSSWQNLEAFCGVGLSLRGYGVILM